MSPSPLDPLSAQKQLLRAQARENRRRLAHKDELSRIICAKLLALPEYQTAQTVLFYLHVRNEVRTNEAIQTALATGRRIAIPWCGADDQLQLFQLSRLDELTIGAHGVPEPLPEFRDLPKRGVSPQELDLVVVPGVAFDRNGGRLGHGLGHYDKFLPHVRPEATLVGLAFECQIFDAVPSGEHDVRMDKIVTERAVYETP